MDMESIKIKIIIQNKNSLLANANISLNTFDFDFVTIKGFQIWKSTHFNERLSEAINITPPTKQAYGHYYQQVFFENKEKWYELELMIYEAFNNALNKGSLKSEDVNVDDIPDDLGQ